MGLYDFRIKIDSIDKELIKLIEKRFEVSKEIGLYKKDNELNILDSSREQEVLRKNLSYMVESNKKEHIKEILEKMIRISKNIQSAVVIDDDTSLESIIGKIKIKKMVKDPVVAFRGIKGSYEEEALIKYFDLSVKELSFKTFHEVVEAVLDGRADYGILPIENTSKGNILDIERLLENNEIYIVGEEIVEIVHCLLGLGEISDIDTIYSHVQGFLQSGDFLKEYNFKEMPYFNTAISAKFVSENGDKSLGAIASRRAADVYGLKVLAEHINFNAVSRTRFIVISSGVDFNDDYNKVSIQVILEDKEDSLSNIIKSIAENRLNMVKIASRPIIGKPFEYIFSIDFNGNVKDKKVKMALKEIKEQSILINFKGNYKEAKRR